MLQLKNTTPFKAKILLMPDPDGIDSLYTVIKATFVLDTEPTPADEQIPIAAEEKYLDEPGQSSLKVPSDIGLIKPGTDILMMGNAYAPAGRPATETDVSLAAGPVAKTIRVFGDRYWTKVLGAIVPSPPHSFERMSIIYERAYGGWDRSHPDPAKHQFEPRNPVGTGFLDKHANYVEGIWLPNLEDPKHPVRNWQDRPGPVCFGAICPSWEPRKSYAGTYDEEWQKHRMPYLPKDFDPLFFQLAPPDQVVPDYLKGGEEIQIRGATPSGQLQFCLPTYRIQVTYRLDNKDHIRLPNLDTVIIEPDESRLILLWRTVYQCDKKALRINEVQVAEVSA